MSIVEQMQEIIGRQDKEIAALRAVLLRVRSVHTKENQYHDEAMAYCRECDSVTWPCPTIEALDAEVTPFFEPTDTEHEDV